MVTLLTSIGIRYSGTMIRAGIWKISSNVEMADDSGDWRDLGT